MNHAIVNHLYHLCQTSNCNKIMVPSIRQLSQKFQIPYSEIVQTLNFWKQQGILISEVGSRSFLLKNEFFNYFKNDTQIMFGKEVIRQITNHNKAWKNGYFEYYFERQFLKDNQIVSLSIDFLYTSKNWKIDLNKGLDAYLKLQDKNPKNVFKKTSIINIANTIESEKLNNNFAVLVETSIFSNTHQRLSHSFSLTNPNYYKNFQIEMLL